MNKIKELEEKNINIRKEKNNLNLLEKEKLDNRNVEIEKKGK